MPRRLYPSLAPVPHSCARASTAATASVSNGMAVGVVTPSDALQPPQTPGPPRGMVVAGRSLQGSVRLRDLNPRGCCPLFRTLC